MLKKSIFLIIALLLMLSLFAIPLTSYSADTIKFRMDPSQKIEVPYRLFRTDNMWSQLLLNTEDGRLWQVSFGTGKDDLKAIIPINDKPLISKDQAKVGRFTLYPTDNMWNFLLLDQYDGRVWQCQFSTQSEGRFIIELPILQLN